MTLTMDSSTRSQPHGATVSTDGPIVLAMKPFAVSESPLAVARWLARREDRELRVISIVESHDVITVAAGVPPLPAGFMDDERAAITRRIREALALEGTDGLEYDVTVEQGTGARAVVDAARACRARLIVIGTGRHETVERFIYGERAMEIVRAADRPVLITPRDPVRVPLHNAVVAVDFSQASLRAARAILPMLSPGADLTLVHVRPPTPGAAARRPGTPPMDAPRDDLFARFLGMLALPPGIHVSTKLLWGEPVAAIVDYVRWAGADLLACGRMQRHSLGQQLFLGSVSAGLLRQVRCAILVAPEVADDAHSQERSPLTGVAEWDRTSWTRRLADFSTRNTGRRLRLGVDPRESRGGCVAQDYRLRSISFNRREQLRVVLLEHEHNENRLGMCFSDVRDLTLFTDVVGNDLRLVFEYEGGKGTLTLSPAELP